MVIAKTFGPFKRDGLKILAANGRMIAKVQVSTRIPPEEIDSAGDLLAASWDLREMLRHALLCSGTAADCEECGHAAAMVNDLIREESHGR